MCLKIWLILTFIVQKLLTKKTAIDILDLKEDYGIIVLMLLFNYTMNL